MPSPKASLLGAILVRSARLPLKVLDDALQRQKQNGERLGAILLEMEAITEAQLQEALEQQAAMRRRGDA